MPGVGVFAKVTRSATYPHELHSDQLEALLLETLDDLAHQSTLDGIGLDHDEGALLVSGHVY